VSDVSEESAPGATTGRPLRVAIAGCHRMLSREPGSHNFAADFAAVPETTVVAVCDRGAATRDAFRACWRGAWGDLPAYDDFARMVGDGRPDVVADRVDAVGERVGARGAPGVRG
jgi:predicted dehydrogenase